MRSRHGKTLENSLGPLLARLKERRKRMTYCKPTLTVLGEALFAIQMVFGRKWGLAHDSLLDWKAPPAYDLDD